MLDTECLLWCMYKIDNKKTTLKQYFLISKSKSISGLILKCASKGVNIGMCIVLGSPPPLDTMLFQSTVKACRLIREAVKMLSACLNLFALKFVLCL